MQSEQQAQFTSSAQTAYQMLAQAVETLQAQNGVVHTGPLDTGSNGNMLRNDFCNVLQCVSMDTTQNLTNGGINYYNYKSSSIAFNTASWNPLVAATILNNGIYLLWFHSYGNCTTGDPGTNACGYFMVDTNGTAGPNMLGDDMIQFMVVLNNGVYSILPAGAPGDSNNGTACSIGSGLACTYWRLFNPNGMP